MWPPCVSRGQYCAGPSVPKGPRGRQSVGGEGRRFVLKFPCKTGQFSPRVCVGGKGLFAGAAGCYLPVKVL